MSLRVSGLPQLRRRLKALENAPRPMLQKVQVDAVRYAKENTRPFRKTGDLGRSIIRGQLARDFAIVKATKNYAGYVELGTRPHDIRPRNAKVLAWPASPGGRRLSGSARRGAAMRFAKRVHHPGTKPQPFLLPGAKRALEDVGWKSIVTDAWNGAA